MEHSCSRKQTIETVNASRDKLLNNVVLKAKGLGPGSKLPPSQLPTLLDPYTLIVKLSRLWGMRKTIQETLQTPTSEN